MWTGHSDAGGQCDAQISEQMKRICAHGFVVPPDIAFVFPHDLFLRRRFWRDDYDLLFDLRETAFVLYGFGDAS